MAPNYAFWSAIEAYWNYLGQHQHNFISKPRWRMVSHLIVSWTRRFQGDIGDAQHTPVSRSIGRLVYLLVTVFVYFVTQSLMIRAFWFLYSYMVIWNKCATQKNSLHLYSLTISQWPLLKNRFQTSVQPLIIGTDWNWYGNRIICRCAPQSDFLPVTFKGCSVTDNIKSWLQSAQPRMITAFWNWYAHTVI